MSGSRVEAHLCSMHQRAGCVPTDAIINAKSKVDGSAIINAKSKVAAGLSRPFTVEAVDGVSKRGSVNSYLSSHGLIYEVDYMLGDALARQLRQSAGEHTHSTGTGHQLQGCLA